MLLGESESISYEVGRYLGLDFLLRQHLVMKQYVPIQQNKISRVPDIVYAKITQPDRTVCILVPSGAFELTPNLTTLFS